MKKNLFFGMLSTAALAGLISSCAGDDFSISSSTGGIAPVVDLDADVVTASPKGRAAAAISVDDLALSLTSADGSVSKEWASVNDFDKNTTFRVGTYTLAAHYGSLENEGFDSPYYYGESTFEVEENKTTSVAVTASLANSMVKIEYTDAFVDYFSRYSLKLHSEGGAYIDYSADETRPAYLRPGKVTIIADVVKQNGVSASLEAASFTAKPRYCYTVTIDVNNGGTGSAELVITFDDNVAEEDVTIDLSDEVLNAPAPQVTCSGFDPEQSYTVVSGMDATISPKLNIIARGGIAAVTMTTESKTLEEQGWLNEIDLCSATASQQATLQGLGLSVRGLFGNVDQMAVIDLANVISNLKHRQNGSNTTKITFVVKDKIGKVTDPITLSIDVEPIEIAASDPSDLYLGDEEVSFKLTHNGSDPEKDVDVLVMNQRGTFDRAEVLSITPISRSTSDYLVTIKVSAEINPVKIKTVCNGVESEVITIKRIDPEYTITINENDVFSTYAIFDVFDKAGNAADVPATATIEIAEDGGDYATKSYTVDGKSVKITGLTASTKYNARIRFDGIPSQWISMTTESGKSLENGSLDESTWSIVKERNYENHQYAVSGWDTMNGLTQSQDYTAALTYGYIATSGTKPESAGKIGGAALIRTVGWGTGNTASANFLNQKSFGTCNHLTPGELFLGKWNGADLPNSYGIEFDARPSSLEFYYKYATAYDNDNGDYGTAEISVYDKSGNVIATKSIELSKQSDYSIVVLDLTYPRNAAKASKVSVAFKSSGNSDCLVTNSTYVKPPKPMNLGSEEYVGSQLWIDEVKLNY